MTQTKVCSGFLVKNIAVSLLLLLLILLIFEYSNIDLAVQQQLYDASRHDWLLAADEPVTRLVLYDGVNYALYALAAALLVILVFLRNFALVERYRAGLLIVLLSLILVPGTVALLKAATNMPCPRNLQLFGAEAPYVRLFESFPETFEATRRYKCFPAAHTSGGFALLSLFFLFKTPKNRRRAVMSAGSLGAVLGGYKMLIGDHFLSHTVVSFIWAWFLISIIALTVFMITGKDLTQNGDSV